MTPNNSWMGCFKRVALLGALMPWLWGSLLAATVPGPAAPARPNIILILADDLGFSDLGCYGSEIATPNLDKLSAGGLRFSQFYTTPRCCPTRASLLTGVYPQQAGIGNMMEDRGLPGYRGELSTNCLTVGEELRAARYRTALAGKWHVSHIHFNGKAQLNFLTNEPFWEDKKGWPLQRGFDRFYGTIHGVNSYYDPFSLVRGNEPTRPEGKDYYYTDAISDNAIGDIDTFSKGGDPFFLYVAYTAPHWPLQAPEADIAPYRSTYLAGWDVIRTNRHRRQIELGLMDKAWPLTARGGRMPAWETVPNKEWQANRMATYAAMVERMDRGIGRIMARVSERGIDKNTLVIFLSDNGGCDEVIQPGYYDIPSQTRDGRRIRVGNEPSFAAGPEEVWQSYGIPWANVSDTPFRLYKHFVHEGGISIPLIAFWPAGIKKTNQITRQVGHVTDLMATFVEVAGATHPISFNGHPVLPLEGKSLLPVLQGRERPSRFPLFWEHEGNRAVRDGKWKLVARHGEPWELYDVEADRTELRNLQAQEPERVKQMTALYAQWAARCGVMPWENLPKARPTAPARPGL